MFAVTSHAHADSPIPVSVLQRSVGIADLVMSRTNGTYTPKRIFQQGVMKARFSAVAADSVPEVVLLNLAGGLTGGDRLELGVTLEEGSAAMLTTQGCERIYRSVGDNAVITADIRLAAGAMIEWLPLATILFDGARLSRETHVELAAGAKLLAVECLIFGRTAHGESVTSGALSDSWLVYRDGRLIHAECFAIADNIQEALDKPSVLDGNRAMATLRYVAPDAEERIEHVRTLLVQPAEERGTVAAASAWNGMILVRFVASDGYRLMRQVGRVLAGFRGKPLPRSWQM
jgi:urease accessory protein